MTIRVVVAEDSPTARALLVAILESDRELRVVGEATDGHQAVALAKKLRPDVMTVDIHMPGMGGFDAIRRIMSEAPTPIVVVSSSVGPQDVAASLASLNAGALTALPKPLGPQSADFEEQVRQLTATVKSMSEVKVVRRWSSTPAQAAPRALAQHVTHLSPRPASGALKLLTIGASTGGPAALYRIFSGLPAQFPLPILVVQHISQGFLPGLLDWWKSASSLEFRVALAGARLEPGVVYVAPDAHHLEVSARNTVVISHAAPVDGHRPSASVLFKSAAAAHGSAVLALILTGMGRDGVDGLRDVHARGGHVVAQDQDSCIVFGMPGAAIAAGVVNDVVPLGTMATHLTGLLNSSPQRATH